jgi:hypothetical protein
MWDSFSPVCPKQLGLKLTDRVNMKMAGVPEKSFAEWAGKLIGLGYKVGFMEFRLASAVVDVRLCFVGPWSSLNPLLYASRWQKPTSENLGWRSR